METIFTGIAVVIDDEIGKDRAIDNLISQINKRKMPCLTYDQLPETDVINHFNGISFLILDWKLHNGNVASDITEGVSLPGAVSEANIRENIYFLKALIKSCFVPIFIFTNESKDDVISTLKQHGLYDENGCNRIFVKSKSELSGKNNTARTRLFSTINKWAKRNPSVYVLKIWEGEYQEAKDKLFNDFFNISPYWPQILWKTFTDDGVNKSFALGEIITRNIYTRMSPFEFPDEILKKPGRKITKEEMRKVLEGERFVTKDDLHGDLIEPGDVFRKSSGKIYLNIRPACDTTIRDDRDSIMLYVLTGTKLSPQKEKEVYNNKYGEFNEQHNQAIVLSIQGKTYDFRFKDLKLIEWNDLKEKLIGRLLPPYITRIQQRYALYLQRQGLPRTPEIAVLGNGGSATPGETTGS